MMDERSRAKGVNMIHGSFVGISPAHAFSHTLCCSVSQKCTSFVNTFPYNARWIPPLALHEQKKKEKEKEIPATLFECQQQERRQRAFNTLPPVSRGRWREVQGGVCAPRHTQIWLSNASDSISFVYMCSQAHVEWSDDGNSFWRWMLFSHLLNRRTPVFTESQSGVGGKESGKVNWKMFGEERSVNGEDRKRKVERNGDMKDG